jgi:SAM-dependent methyltransferase
VDDEEYRRMADNGERHWWYRNTRLLLQQILEPQLPSLPSPAEQRMFLDAAGGTGATGGWLTHHAPTVVADYEQFTLEVARREHADYLPTRADINRLPFASRSFDLVLCVTALCHRMNPDPTAIVREFARVSKPGGLVCLWEPGGGDWLRRGHDDVTQSARRFSVKQLSTHAQEAGLEIVTATGAYSFLVPPAYAMHLFERGESKSDVGRNQSGLGGLLGVAARAERAVLRRVRIPVGLSSIVLARVV